MLQKLANPKHLNETWTKKLLFVSHKILKFLGHKIFVKIYNLINFECHAKNSHSATSKFLVTIPNSSSARLVHLGAVYLGA